MSEKIELNESQCRILYLYQLLFRYSDTEHPLSTKALLDMMEKYYHIQMHRTTIPKYIKVLNACGMEVMITRDRAKSYYLSDRKFELPELRLLIDAVMSSRFIPEKKSRELVEKITSLASKNDAEKLNHIMYTAGKVKADNKSSYYIVDAINEAINTNRRISFLYTEYDHSKRLVLKNDGEPYTLSPYALLMNGDYYYVVGYSHNRDRMATFRVDRIHKEPKILSEIRKPVPVDFDISRYSVEVFRMYDTEEPEIVSLLCENELMKHLIDQFGMDIDTEIEDEEHFRANVQVCASSTFYCWVFGWRGKVKILSPTDVAEKYRELARKAAEL